MTLRERYEIVIERFEENMPIVDTELIYNDPFQLTVAVILSAQCTDKRVNMITPKLFEKYPDAKSMAQAEVSDIYELIKSCSYPNSKAKHLSAMSKKVVDTFDGIIPSEREQLESLPGVGRKTANVISAVIFNKPVMAVDTHVFRVSERIGLVHNSKTPLETEKQLTKNIPPEIIPKAHHWLILHGRYTCKARKPLCNKYFLTDCCKYYGKLKTI
ncbi:MAG: endonuclease III [Bacteroidales bacterium]|nr:endonuclease III [Bacteroidales bacterium]